MMLLLLAYGLKWIAAIDARAATSLVEHLTHLAIAHQAGRGSSG